MNAGASLAGRRVLLTRPAHASSRLAGLLEEHGARVDVRPTIALLPPEDPEPALELLSRLPEFDWVLFTSRNGVRFFHRLKSEHPSTANLAIPRAAAIGPDTANAMEELGIAVDRIAEQPNSEGLAATMKGVLREGQRVLWVRPEKARPVLGQALSALGVECSECRCYRSLAAPEAASIAADYATGKYDVAVFASASAFLHLAGADSRVAGADATRVVALGPVTAAAIARTGTPVAAVAQGTAEQALCQAVLALFE